MMPGVAISFLFLTAFQLVSPMNDDSVIISGNEEFRDVSKGLQNPYQEDWVKESFPPYISCEFLGTTYDMFFYKGTLTSCAPAQWNCEFNDEILLPNKTMAHCYNKRNFGVSCLYMGFKPKSNCRQGHSKCGLNHFSCKEKKPRANVKYSDTFLLKLGRAVKSKNISVDENLLADIEEAGTRRMSENGTNSSEYDDTSESENSNEEDLNPAINDTIVYLNKKEDSTTSLSMTNFSIVPTLMSTEEEKNDIVITQSTTMKYDTTQSLNEHTLEKQNTYSISPIDDLFTVSPNLKNNTNNNSFQETNKNIDSKGIKNDTVHLTLFDNVLLETKTFVSKYFEALKTIFRDPISLVILLIIFTAINIIICIICYKLCCRSDFVYEVAENQRLMEINHYSKRFNNNY
uniref:WSC domain-containing protein n=1 Tax=Parastrongyloides trichosuri TaxID=131310 RepID=A0A0N4ZHK2_PARTI